MLWIDSPRASCAIFFCIQVTTARAATLHVPADYPTIQSCIDAAVSGQDECVVAPGTYNELINFLGKAITLRSSHGPAVTIIDATGLSGSVVTCVHGEQATTRFGGFTVTGGSGFTFYDYKLGGGMYINSTNPSVSNCIFWRNSADDGGALYLLNSELRIFDCEFIANIARDGGGAIASFGSQPSFVNCKFLENSTSGSPGLGGAIYNNQSSPNIQSCILAYNIGNSGGAIFTEYGIPTITKCAFVGNRANSGGGMLNVYWSNPNVNNSLFISNTATRGWGGGLLVTSHASPKILGCTFEGNQASNGGSALAILQNSHARISNSIFHGHTPSVLVETEQYHPTFEYNDIAGGLPARAIDGGGNVDLDPMFVRNSSDGGDGWTDNPATVDIDEGENDDYGDLRLQPGSPCINAGDPNSVQGPGETDLDGHARVLCGRVDMGAYESAIGDFDCNQAVNLNDLSAWSACMTDPQSGPYMPGCESFDFDGDGDVDLRDFAGFELIANP